MFFFLSRLFASLAIATFNQPLRVCVLCVCAIRLNITLNSKFQTQIQCVRWKNKLIHEFLCQIFRWFNQLSSELAIKCCIAGNLNLLFFANWMSFWPRKSENDTQFYIVVVTFFCLFLPYHFLSLLIRMTRHLRFERWIVTQSTHTKNTQPARHFPSRQNETKLQILFLCVSLFYNLVWERKRNR